MRKPAAILLLCVFALSQYARQLSYLECSLVNLFKTSTTRCDCEVQAGFTELDEDPVPGSSQHSHLHLDEYFYGVPNAAALLLITEPISISWIMQQSGISGGYESPPWQPPSHWLIG